MNTFKIWLDENRYTEEMMSAWDKFMQVQRQDSQVAGAHIVISTATVLLVTDEKVVIDMDRKAHVFCMN